MLKYRGVFELHQTVVLDTALVPKPVLPFSCPPIKALTNLSVMLFSLIHVEYKLSADPSPFNLIRFNNYT